MKLPISWLKEFADTNESVERICDALVNVGFEVEDVIRYGNFSGVVVGKIIAIEPHPDADKLRICTVDVGEKQLIIVTGAKNVEAGDVVPVALDGAVLPDKTIKAAPLRGVMSYGMMCSGAELGISEAFCDGASVDGIMILDSSLKAGDDLKNVLCLDEVVLDVSITANRPDCHSILGLAREVATALDCKFREPSFDFELDESDLKMPEVKIFSPDCPAYTCGLVSDVKIQKSPKWMQRRLFMCGINPINNIVDITNYVLLEIGQPLHAFDLNMIEGGINVRLGHNEELTALNGEKYTLTETMTVISDSIKPLAIAGVMGGEYSGISDKTEAVLIESARFNRGSVRNTSLKLGLRSDSSARFERGVDYYGVEYGRRRALALIRQLGAGKIVADKPLEKGESKVIVTALDDINSLLGIEIPKKNIVDILETLGMEVALDCRRLIVKIPAYREDIDNFTDLVEEVIRFYGYDKLKETFMPTSSVTIGGMSHRQKRLEEIKDVMCSLGAYEIMTYSFTDDKVFDKLNLAKSDERRKAIRIINPISEELSVMKTELVSGMLSVIFTNLNRKNDKFRLFELAKTYVGDLPLKELPTENDTLCVGLVEDGDFYEIKNVFTEVLRHFGISYKVERSSEPYLHPGISADIIAGGKVVGSCGKLHPLVAKHFGIKKSDVYIGSLDCGVITSNMGTAVKYKPLPKFPSVERDLAFVVDENAAVGNIIDTIKSFDPLIGDVELFDVYRGEQIESGFKSVALKIKLVPIERTLVDGEIAKLMSGIIEMLSRTYGAKVRE